MNDCPDAFAHPDRTRLIDRLALLSFDFIGLAEALLIRKYSSF